MKLIHPMLAGLMCILAAGSANADVAYTFDHDLQGFSTVGDGTLVLESAGGRSYLRATDTNGSTDLYLSVPLSAPSVDWSAYLGGTISFDARMLSDNLPSWGDFGTIRLTSATNEVVLADLAPNLPSDPYTPVEPTSLWKTYSATLDSANFSNQGGATLAGVLANLKSVTLSMEAGNGPVEVVGVDNFKVTSSVPEPQTWALSLMGLLALGLSKRRARS
jgi:hypothetical protein